MLFSNNLITNYDIEPPPNLPFHLVHPVVHPVVHPNLPVALALIITCLILSSDKMGWDMFQSHLHVTP